MILVTWLNLVTPKPLYQYFLNHKNQLPVENQHLMCSTFPMQCYPGKGGKEIVPFFTIKMVNWSWWVCRWKASSPTDGKEIFPNSLDSHQEQRILHIHKVTVHIFHIIHKVITGLLIIDWPDSELEDWMDDTVEVDDSLTLRRLWMSAIWSDSSSKRRRRYLDASFIFCHHHHNYHHQFITIITNPSLSISIHHQDDHFLENMITSAPYAGSLGHSGSFGPGLPSSGGIESDLVLVINIVLVIIITNSSWWSKFTLMKCLALLSSPSVVCRELSLPTGTWEY